MSQEALIEAIGLLADAKLDHLSLSEPGLLVAYVQDDLPPTVYKEMSAALHKALDEQGTAANIGVVIVPTSATLDKLSDEDLAAMGLQRVGA